MWRPCSHVQAGAATVTHPTITDLSALKPGAWFHVATRCTRGGMHAWDWTLCDADRRVLLRMRDPGPPAVGTVTTTHEHLPDGTVRLLARLVPVGDGTETGSGSATVGAGRVQGALPDLGRGEGAAGLLRGAAGRAGVTAAWDGLPPDPSTDAWHWVRPDPLVTDQPLLVARWHALDQRWGLYGVIGLFAPGQFGHCSYAGPCEPPVVERAA